MSEAIPVSLYWSMRSPYCYFVLDRALTLAARPQVALDLRIVLPGVFRFPERFAAQSDLRSDYFAMDCRRTAAFLGLPFARPRPDPVVFEPDGRHASPEQPYIWRLSYLALLANRQGKGLTFLDHVMRLLWDGSTENWDQGGHFAGALAAAGLDLAALEALAAEHREDLHGELLANGKALEATGHWGVPTFVVGDEPFFGQDRFDQLLWRLKQKGVSVS